MTAKEIEEIAQSLIDTNKDIDMSGDDFWVMFDSELLAFGRKMYELGRETR